MDAKNYIQNWKYVVKVAKSLGHVPATEVCLLKSSVDWDIMPCSPVKVS
jgi:hypothetical protein